MRDRLTIRHVAWTATAAAIITAAPLAQRAVAQTPPDTIPPDSTVRDSARVGPIHPPWQPALVMLAAAPPGLVLLMNKKSKGDPPVLGFWKDHVAAHVAGGVALAYSDSNSWAYSASLEVLERGFYGELRTEHFRLPEYYSYRTIRIGYLTNPRPTVATGVTLGYRDTRRVSRHRGVEVGLPFVVGNRRRWVRLETAYVMSMRRSSWNFRWQGEWLVAGGPLYVGVNMEAKTLPLSTGSKVSSVPIAVLVGVRR